MLDVGQVSEAPPADDVLALGRWHFANPPYPNTVLTTNRLKNILEIKIHISAFIITSRDRRDPINYWFSESEITTH